MHLKISARASRYYAYVTQNIEKTIFHQGPEEFYGRVARTPEEACRLIEVGFEYVCDMDGKAIFRKRK